MTKKEIIEMTEKIAKNDIYRFIHEHHNKKLIDSLAD